MSSVHSARLIIIIPTALLPILLFTVSGVLSVNNNNHTTSAKNHTTGSNNHTTGAHNRTSDAHSHTTGAHNHATGANNHDQSDSKTLAEAPSFCAELEIIVGNIIELSNNAQCASYNASGDLAYYLSTVEDETERNDSVTEAPAVSRLLNRPRRAATPKNGSTSDDGLIGKGERCRKRFVLCSQVNSTHQCYQSFELVAYDEPNECLRSMELKDVFHLKSHNQIDYDPLEEEFGGEELGVEEHQHPAFSKVWLYGILCCTAEIILARVGVILLPLMRKDLYEKLILTMVGLAAGTLMGSAIFHLLPKAFSLERYYEQDKYLRQCLEIAGGVWLFLVVERTLKIAFFYNERKILHRRDSQLGNVLASQGAKGWQDSMSVIFVSSQPGRRSQRATQSTDKHHSSPTATEDGRENSHENPGSVTSKVVDGKVEIRHSTAGLSPNKYKPDPDDIHPIRFQEGSMASVSTEAWMIIFGDGFLDFVDGVSIGTGFQDSLLTGFSISLGILLEEIPHELGEFAVLLNAGLSFKQALVLKFLSSCTTYLGLCVGIWLGGIEAGHIVFALAAGMFLYIALVDMIPELNISAVKASKYSVFRGLKVLVLQNFGLLIGMAVIYVMALYEDIFRKL